MNWRVRWLMQSLTTNSKLLLQSGDYTHNHVAGLSHWTVEGADDLYPCISRACGIHR